MSAGIIDFNTHTRSEGHSVAAALAYRAGLALTDNRVGEVHDYTRRDEGDEVAAHGIESVRPSPLAANEQTLADAMEAAEKRKDSRIARAGIFTIPPELDDEAKVSLTREIATRFATRLDIVVAWAVHPPGNQGDDRNWHAHLVLSTRVLTKDGTAFGAKTEKLDNPRTSGDEVAALRNLAADTINEHLGNAGLDTRVDVGRRLDQEGRNISGNVVQLARRRIEKRTKRKLRRMNARDTVAIDKAIQRHDRKAGTGGRAVAVAVAVGHDITPGTRGRSRYRGRRPSGSEPSPQYERYSKSRRQRAEEARAAKAAAEAEAVLDPGTNEQTETEAIPAPGPEPVRAPRATRERRPRRRRQRQAGTPDGTHNVADAEPPSTEERPTSTPRRRGDRPERQPRTRTPGSTRKRRRKVRGEEPKHVTPVAKPTVQPIGLWAQEMLDELESIRVERQQGKGREARKEEPTKTLALYVQELADDIERIEFERSQAREREREKQPADATPQVHPVQNQEEETEESIPPTPKEEGQALKWLSGREGLRPALKDEQRRIGIEHLSGQRTWSESGIRTELEARPPWNRRHDDWSEEGLDTYSVGPVRSPYGASAAARVLWRQIKSTAEKHFGIGETGPPRTALPPAENTEAWSAATLWGRRRQRKKAEGDRRVKILKALTDWNASQADIWRRMLEAVLPCEVNYWRARAEARAEKEREREAEALESEKSATVIAIPRSRRGEGFGE